MVTQPKTSILMVDDEEDVRVAIRTMILGSEFTIWEAKGWKEALAFADSSNIGIDILLTDILIPPYNGRDLAVKIVRKRPGVRVLYISGYSMEVLRSYGLCPEGSHLLAKPFDRDLLLKRLRALASAKPLAGFPMVPDETKQHSEK